MDTKDVLARAGAILEELDSYQSVLDKVEAEKDTVRPKIYKKVRDEYLEKIHRMQGKTGSLMEELDSVKKNMEQRRIELKSRMEELDDRMEEIDFRLRVGDMSSETASTERENLGGDVSAVTGELKSLEKELGTLQELASRLSPGAEPSGASHNEADQQIPPYPPTQKESDTRAPMPRSDEKNSTVDLSPDDENKTEKKRDQANTAAESEFFDDGSVLDASHGEGFRGGMTVVDGANAGHVFIMESDRIQIGRDTDNEVQILDTKMSRRHFIIERRKSGYFIRDLGSSNGTYLNDKRIEESALKDQDEIRVGNTIMRFELKRKPKPE